VRALHWISGLAWIASWRIIYLEVFRWHHMTKTLRFSGPPTPPGGIPARPGLPLRAACFAAVTAPLIFLATAFAGRTSRPSARR
jgi:hypothetical protein